MFDKTCGDCDHFDFDTNTCLLDDSSKEISQTCDSFQNNKSDDYEYFGES
jgi:hypothetical protein